MLGIQSLADRRSELCRTLFKQIVNNWVAQSSLLVVQIVQVWCSRCNTELVSWLLNDRETMCRNGRYFIWIGWYNLWSTPRINVFLHGKSLEDTINKANNTLSHLSAWFCANKLSFSINKTLYSIFGKHANDEHNTTVHLCNNDIQEVNCCKYLGVYVDNTLLWKIILNIYIKSYWGLLVYCTNYDTNLIPKY